MKEQLRELHRKRRRTTRIILFSSFAVFIIVVVVMARIFLNRLNAPNVTTPNKENFVLYIPTGASFEQVKDSLYAHKLIVDHGTFEWVAKQKQYPDHIKPGRYVISDGMNNANLINMLRSGNQATVKVTFNNVRTVEQLAGKVAPFIEADSCEIVDYVKKSDSISAWGFNAMTVPALFLPNTYDFYWNTDAEKFVVKMKKEYDKFWDEKRMEKANSIGLSPIEVSILASIVDKETNKIDEMPRIAGVYLNRLKSGWLLQADPTLVFAVGDFELKRVLNEHKEVESPYNTYKYPGLPPGPICIPSLQSINAVLDAEEHNYYYFCAKEDFSGYHVFAKTLAEHNRNAQRYHQALKTLNP